MNDETMARVMRATELTRAGRLAEATAVLQGGVRQRWDAAGAPASAGRSGTPADDVIDGECVEVVDPAAPCATETTGESSAHLATTARPGWLRRHVFRGRNTRQDAAPQSEPAINPSTPGQFITGQYRNAAGERAYKLYIPTRYAGQRSPLVMMLHGCTQDPDDFAAGTQMNKLGDAHDCFVLYPAQSKSANTSQCWNWYQRENQIRNRGEPSIIAGMADEIAQGYNIDASRVYVAGMSAGGAMAAVMAVTYPERFAAVGIHSGLACGSAHDLPSALAAMKGMPAPLGASAGRSGTRPHSTPTIVFHGDRDRTVHPRNGADVIAQSTHAQDDNGAHATSERGQATSGHAYTRTIHRDASDNVMLEHWLVHGGGHAWFGGSRAGTHTDPRGPNATQEMLRFFLRRA